MQDSPVKMSFDSKTFLALAFSSPSLGNEKSWDHLLGCLAPWENLYQHWGTDLPLSMLLECSGEEASLDPTQDTAPKSAEAFLDDLQSTQLIPQNHRQPKVPYSFVQRNPSPCTYDFSVHDQKHLLQFQGAFSLMQSIHFCMMQHKTNLLAFALCCVEGTLMAVMYLNPKCWKSLNQLLPNPTRTPQAVQEAAGEPGIQWPTSYLITI